MGTSKNEAGTYVTTQEGLTNDDRAKAEPCCKSGAKHRSTEAPLGNKGQQARC